ncbi:hypothetical protein [Myroides odoratus]|uniref:hypothetical protein n=1 Tax=Myroides odoratus TaxID=256 RepID=UPI000ACB9CE4|nr:hypothetical protein [Myroides odoratus]
MKWIGDTTTFIDLTDRNENGNNQQEANVYHNAEAYIPAINAVDAFKRDNTPF